MLYETTFNVPLSQRLLSLFCSEATTVGGMVHYQPSSELDVLSELFPDLMSKVRGKRVVDFGCGHGYQSVALAHAGAACVTGVETEADLAGQAAARVQAAGLGDRVRIVNRLENEAAQVIISQNSFEHFTRPRETLLDLERALAPGGLLYVTFGPLWYSPRGAHMGHFCRLPWVNLFFSEGTIMAVRSRFRSDGKRTYREAGLGQLTLRRFEELIEASGLQFEWRRYDSVAGLPLVGRIPWVRELFVNRVSCILGRAASRHVSGSAN